MKICIIGKHPPIQGGVSKSTAELALGLSALGNDVHVVTNAMEVEPPYRIHTSELFPKINLPHNLKIHYTASLKQSYIPFAKPYVSKLAGLAKKIVIENKCDLIFSIYLEPYAIAAQLVSLWTNVPFLVSHAGSDVGSLMQHPDLHESYLEILHNCHGILTRPGMSPFFRNLGIPSEKILIKHKNLALDIQDYVDTKKDSALDLNQYIDQVLQLDVPYINTYMKPFLNKKVQHDSFVIGMYGKTGTFKGHMSLIQAIAKLDSTLKARVAIVFLTQGSEAGLKQLGAEIQALELSDQVFLLPFIPAHMISAFVRSCHCIGFLEHKFPIKIHMPSVPREVLIAGGCLLLSKEIASKQNFHLKMKHFENIVLVEPSDVESMAIEIGQLIQNPYMAKSIGHAGKSLIGGDPIKESDDNALFGQQIFQLTKAHFSKTSSLRSYAKKRQLYFEYVFSNTHSHFKSKFNQVLNRYLKTAYLTQDKVVEEQVIDLYESLSVSDDSKLHAVATFDFNYFSAVLSTPVQSYVPTFQENNYTEIALAENIRLQKMCFDPESFERTAMPLSLVFKPKEFYGNSGIYSVSEDTYLILNFFLDNEGPLSRSEFLNWVATMGYNTESADSSVESLRTLGFLRTF
jgi:glycosyltransferase involved in cell wall biosynthesis